MLLHHSFVRIALPPAIVFVLLFGALKWAGNESLGREYVQPLLKHAAFVLEAVFDESTKFQSRRLDEVRVVNVLATEDQLFVVLSPSSMQLLLLALMIAFIITWPASVLQKVVGILFGTAYFYMLDIARVVSMLLIEIYIPTWFALFKQWVFPVLFVILVAAYATTWQVLTVREKPPSQ